MTTSVPAGSKEKGFGLAAAWVIPGFLVEIENVFVARLSIKSSQDILKAIAEVCAQSGKDAQQAQDEFRQLVDPGGE